MDKLNVVDKKTMEASDAILKTCIEKLDLKRCVEVAEYWMGSSPFEYFMALASLILNEIDTKADLDKTLQFHRVMCNICLDKNAFRKKLFFCASKKALSDEMDRMVKLKEEREKASKIIEKYENDVCNICNGREYFSGRIDHYIKLLSDIVNA